MKNKWNIKKCKWIVIATAIVLSFLIVFAYSRSVSRKMIKAEAGMTYELMKEEIVDYVEQYIAGENMTEHVSEEEAELISREISTRLVKAMPQESMPDEEREELHAFVLQTVQEQLAGLNDGKIDNLKTSFDAILAEYDSDKEFYDTLINTLKGRIGSMETHGATNEELETAKADLADFVNKRYGELEASTSEGLAKVQTDLTEEAAASEASDANLQNRIDTLKGRIDSMETHGTTNEELEKAKADLADLVNKRYGELEASTAEGLAKVQTGLTEEAAARDAAINDAVSNAVSDLNSDITASVSALSDTLTADITASVSALSDTLTADKAASEASDANLQNQIDVLSGSFAESLGGFEFGYTEDGKPGYREAGADTFSPFSEGIDTSNFKQVYSESLYYESTNYTEAVVGHIYVIVIIGLNQTNEPAFGITGIDTAIKIGGGTPAYRDSASGYLIIGKATGTTIGIGTRPYMYSNVLIVDLTAETES